MKSKDVLTKLQITRPTLSAYVKAGVIKVNSEVNGHYNYDENSVNNLYNKLFNNNIENNTINNTSIINNTDINNTEIIIELLNNCSIIFDYLQKIRLLAPEAVVARNKFDELLVKLKNNLQK